jgi:hypothetical protein
VGAVSGGPRLRSSPDCPFIPTRRLVIICAATDGPLPLLVAELQKGLNPLGNVTVTGYNDGLNGSVLAGLVGGDDAFTKYNAWKAANGGAPDIYLGTWLMNDARRTTGTRDRRSASQSDGGSPCTFWGRVETLVAQLVADGVDIIMPTSPHRHLDRIRAQFPQGLGLTTAQAANPIIYPLRITHGNIEEYEIEYVLFDKSTAKLKVWWTVPNGTLGGHSATGPAYVAAACPSLWSSTRPATSRQAPVATP